MQSYIDALYNAATKIETDPSDQINTLVVKHIRDEAIKLEQLQEHNMYIRTPSAVIAPDLSVIGPAYNIDLSNTIALGSFTPTTWSDIITGLETNTTRFTQQTDRLEIETDNGDNWLKATMSADAVTADRIQLIEDTVQSTGKRTITQTIEFQPDFDYGGGGDTTTQADDWKDHGKVGFGTFGRQDPNGTISSGTTLDPDSYSARLVWRGETMKVYLYHQNQPNSEGEEFPQSVNQIGTGHPITPGTAQVWKMAVDVANGTLEAWCDGTKFVDATGLTFMSATQKHTGILFSGWYGGGGTDYEPVSDQYFRVKDVSIVDS